MRTITNRLLLLLAMYLGGCTPLQAAIKVPSLFSDHMLLQQQTSAPVWGWAEAGELVTATGSWGSRATATTQADGTWKLFLKTPSHGGPYTLSIEGTNRITIKDVLIGEVWLCAGQSNLGWRLSATFNGKEAAAAANAPALRIFRSDRQHSKTPLPDVTAEWKLSSPESAATCSAVSYYFAQKLYEELKLPVGIIVQPFAGTPIEGWMPRAIQLGDPRTRASVQSMDEESAAYDLATANKQLARAMERWKNGERRGKPTLRRPQNEGHQYPGNIFNGLIHPIRPYAIRGAIWYQGERNSKDLAQAANYQGQLTELIRYYRESWHELSDGNVSRQFPFYFVQLPCWHPRQKDPVEADAAWAVNREMMRLVSRSVANTGMAVSIDTGDEVLLHPLDKKPIGLRLAYQALKGTYQRDFVANGPVYESAEVDGNRIILRFHSPGTDLVPGRDGPLDAFAIAGADRRFHWAKATIMGNTVVVSAAAVPQPKAVRYAWAMNPSQRNLLYNQQGIPASPFRTDSWPLFDPATYMPQPQLKPATPKGYKAIPLTRPATTQ
jgi:sialate O-acetylesterase